MEHKDEAFDKFEQLKAFFDDHHMFTPDNFRMISSDTFEIAVYADGGTYDLERLYNIVGGGHGGTELIDDWKISTTVSVERNDNYNAGYCTYSHTKYTITPKVIVQIPIDHSDQIQKIMQNYWLVWC